MDNLLRDIDSGLIDEALAAFRERQEKVNASLEVVREEREVAHKLYIEKEEELNRLTKRSLDLQRLVDLYLSKGVANPITIFTPKTESETRERLTLITLNPERKRTYFPYPLAEAIFELLKSRSYALSYKTLQTLLREFYESKYEGDFEINLKTLGNAISRAIEGGMEIKRIQNGLYDEVLVGLSSWFNEVGVLKAEYEPHEEVENTEPFL